MLLFGTGLGCFLVVAVSIPVIHRTLAKPIGKLARQMAALAAGGTEIEIEGARTTQGRDRRHRPSALRAARCGALQ